MSKRLRVSIVNTEGREMHGIDPAWDAAGEFSVVHSCGDCAFATSDYDDFERHHLRRWHRLVVARGMEAALDHSNSRQPDARRAIHIFREGGAP